MAPRAVVVSTHLDDAVMSASARLMAGDVEVLTVFAGLPAEGGDVPWWDRLTGATDSRQRVVERLAEDDEALAALGGVPTTRLDLLDEQYRTAPIEPAELAQTLAGELQRFREVWLPAGVGGNKDHRAVREAGQRALELLAEPIDELRLYADVPYSAIYGWPSSVSGRPGDPYLDADWWLEQDLQLRGLDPATLVPHPRLLTPDELARKSRAVAAYRSQLPAVRMTGLSAEREAEILGVELSWEITER